MWCCQFVIHVGINVTDVGNFLIHTLYAWLRKNGNVKGRFHDPYHLIIDELIKVLWVLINDGNCLGDSFVDTVNSFDVKRHAGPSQQGRALKIPAEVLNSL